MSDLDELNEFSWELTQWTALKLLEHGAVVSIRDVNYMSWLYRYSLGFAKKSISLDGWMKDWKVSDSNISTFEINGYLKYRREYRSTDLLLRGMFTLIFRNGTLPVYKLVREDPRGFLTDDWGVWEQDLNYGAGVMHALGVLR